MCPGVGTRESRLDSTAESLVRHSHLCSGTEVPNPCLLGRRNLVTGAEAALYLQRYALSFPEEASPDQAPSPPRECRRRCPAQRRLSSVTVAPGFPSGITVQTDLGGPRARRQCLSPLVCLGFTTSPSPACPPKGALRVGRWCRGEDACPPHWRGVSGEDGERGGHTAGGLGLAC